MWSKLVVAFPCTIAALTVSCASDPLVPYSTHTPPLTLVPASSAGVNDQRGRFRETFCAITERRGEQLPDSRPCDEALVKLADEPPPTGRRVELGSNTSDLYFLVVLGLAWDCFEAIVEPIGTLKRYLTALGYEVDTIPVEGLSSSTRNAEIIRDVIVKRSDLHRGKRLVLVGYSKGAPDVLEAVVTYPEIHEHVAAVVSMAGAVGGTPLADDAPEWSVGMLQHTPGAKCDEGDGGALDSLKSATRKRWLATHTLPDTVQYFSVATYPDPEQISAVLKPSYKKLSQIDPRNDSQLIFYDQLIPGSQLLGYVNADHWAIFLSIWETHELLGKTLVNKNRFPEEILFEAVIRHVEESLKAAAAPGEATVEQPASRD